MVQPGESFWRSAKRWARSLRAPARARGDSGDHWTEPAGNWPADQPLQPGTMIGGFRIERSLGQGAQGDQAEQPRT